MAPARCPGRCLLASRHLLDVKKSNLHQLIFPNRSVQIYWGKRGNPVRCFPAVSQQRCHRIRLDESPMAGIPGYRPAVGCQLEMHHTLPDAARLVSLQARHAPCPPQAPQRTDAGQCIERQIKAMYQGIPARKRRRCCKRQVQKLWHPPFIGQSALPPSTADWGSCHPSSDSCNT